MPPAGDHRRLRTSGGTQSLRNWHDCSEFVRTVYPSPDFVQTLKMSTPIAEHVPVDFELRGCPINKYQLVELLSLQSYRPLEPNLPTHSVCLECKRRGNVCIAVAGGEPCLGPVTMAGCGGLCPAYGRPCFGCFGPMDSPNTVALANDFAAKGHVQNEIERLFRSYSAWAWHSAEP